MVDINIYKNLFENDVIDISVDSDNFVISFMGNGDLYWTYMPKTSFDECLSEYEFNITKENYFLYRSFDELYNSVINNIPFGEKIDEVSSDFNSSFRIGLNIQNKIIWYSDEFPLEEASFVSIEKEDEEFKIKFSRSKNDSLMQTYSVRFRNSGSRYAPYNVVFMNMYNKLRNYDYQMHISEIEYQKEKKNKIKK